MKCAKLMGACRELRKHCKGQKTEKRMRNSNLIVVIEKKKCSFLDTVFTPIFLEKFPITT